MSNITNITPGDVSCVPLAALLHMSADGMQAKYNEAGDFVSGDCSRCTFARADWKYTDRLVPFIDVLYFLGTIDGNVSDLISRKNPTYGIASAMAAFFPTESDYDGKSFVSLNGLLSNKSINDLTPIRERVLNVTNPDYDEPNVAKIVDKEFEVNGVYLNKVFKKIKSRERMGIVPDDQITKEYFRREAFRISRIEDDAWSTIVDRAFVSLYYDMIVKRGILTSVANVSLEEFKTCVVAALQTTEVYMQCVQRTENYRERRD